MKSRRALIQKEIEAAEESHKLVIQRLRVLREMQPDKIAADRIRGVIQHQTGHAAHVSEALRLIQGGDVIEPEPGPGYFG